MSFYLHSLDEEVIVILDAVTGEICRDSIAVDGKNFVVVGLRGGRNIDDPPDVQDQLFCLASF
jgi:hypothetical protein